MQAARTRAHPTQGPRAATGVRARTSISRPRPARSSSPLRSRTAPARSGTRQLRPTVGRAGIAASRTPTANRTPVAEIGRRAASSRRTARATAAKDSRSRSTRRLLVRTPRRGRTPAVEAPTRRACGPNKRGRTSAATTNPIAAAGSRRAEESAPSDSAPAAQRPAPTAEGARVRAWESPRRGRLARGDVAGIPFARQNVELR